MTAAINHTSQLLCFKAQFTVNKSPSDFMCGSTHLLKLSIETNEKKIKNAEANVWPHVRIGRNEFYSMNTIDDDVRVASSMQRLWNETHINHT